MGICRVLPVLVLCTCLIGQLSAQEKTKASAQKEEIYLRPPAVRLIRGNLKRVNLEKGTIEIINRRDGERKQTFSLASKNIPVTTNSVKAPKLSDLNLYRLVLLRVSAVDDVVGIHTLSPISTGVVLSIDEEKREVTFRRDRIMEVVPEAEIIVDGRYVSLKDIPINRRARLALTLDRSKIVGIYMKGRPYRPNPKDLERKVDGILKKVDLKTGELTLKLSEDQKKPKLKTFATVPNVVTSMIDGIGNDLGDLYPGMKLSVWLTGNQEIYRLVAAPPLGGKVKEVDLDHWSITFSPGENERDKTLPVDEKAKIMINGWPSGLQDFQKGWSVYVTPSEDGNQVIALWTLQNRDDWQ